MSKEEEEVEKKAASPWGSTQSAAHLFFPLVSHFLEKLHYHPDDNILWKKVNIPG